jgi:hypothetical protein
VIGGPGVLLDDVSETDAGVVDADGECHGTRATRSLFLSDLGQVEMMTIRMRLGRRNTTRTATSSPSVTATKAKLSLLSVKERLRERGDAGSSVVPRSLST